MSALGNNALIELFQYPNFRYGSGAMPSRFFRFLNSDHRRCVYRVHFLGVSCTRYPPIDCSSLAAASRPGVEIFRSERNAHVESVTKLNIVI